jgi:hypothetical protein
MDTRIGFITITTRHDSWKLLTCFLFLSDTIRVLCTGLPLPILGLIDYIAHYCLFLRLVGIITLINHGLSVVTHREAAF